jgi:phosphate/sulfate permease
MGNGVLLFWLIFGFVMAIVNLSFAMGVSNDANKLRLVRARLYFVGPAIWFLATLLGGVFVAGTYWLIHYSTLNPENLKDKSTSIL